MLDLDLSANERNNTIQGSGRERLAFCVDYFAISVTITKRVHECLSIFLGW
jgi:hypothetical protein